jgi:hypothetical protein
MRHLVLWLLLAHRRPGVVAMGPCGVRGLPVDGPGGRVRPSPMESVDLGAPTARLYLVSDLAGALEPCGCTKDQLGGLDKFGAWVRRSGRDGRFVAHVSSVVAAAGPLFFMDPRLTPPTTPTRIAPRPRRLARVMRRLGFSPPLLPGSTIGTTGRDGLNAAGERGGGRRDRRTGLVGAGSPVRRRSSSATVGGPEDRLRRVRSPCAGRGMRGPALRVPSKVVRARRGRGQRQGANVLVALAAAGRGEAKRIADAIPELTAVVVGSSRANGDANATARRASAWATSSSFRGANHLQTVAVLDLYLRESAGSRQAREVRRRDGPRARSNAARPRRRRSTIFTSRSRPGRGTRQSPRRTSRRAAATSHELERERDALDTPPGAAGAGSFFRYSIKEIRESFGKDPAIETDMAAYYKAVNEHNRTGVRRPPAAPARPRPGRVRGRRRLLDVPPRTARQVWNRTPHAHAYATLSSQFKEFNLDCVGCHVTGYEKPGGSYGHARRQARERAMRGLPRPRLSTRPRPGKQGIDCWPSVSVGLSRVPPSAPRRAIRPCSEAG